MPLTDWGSASLSCKYEQNCKSVVWKTTIKNATLACSPDESWLKSKPLHLCLYDTNWSAIDMVTIETSLQYRHEWM